VNVSSPPGLGGRPPRRGAGWSAVVAAAVLVAALLPVGTAGQAAADSVPVHTPAAVSFAPTSLTLTADPVGVARGAVTTLTGRLSDPGTGAGVAGVGVQVEALAADGTWAGVGSATTDASGVVSTSQVIEASTTLRLHYGTPGSVEESVSPPVPVAVLALTAALSRTAVRVGRPVTVAGVLAAGEGRWLRLERRVGDRWEVLERATTGAGGAYAFAVRPAAAGFWRLRVARGTGPGGAAAAVSPRQLDAYLLHTYAGGGGGTVVADMSVFRTSVAETYADPRGWLRAHHRFRRAEPGRAGDFTVVLSDARYLPSYSSVCSTTYSCRVGRYVVINQTRWRTGSPYFPGTLAEYRDMVVNHETGHWLGRGHAYCPGPGRLAPVMQQQSKGLHGCRPNPWPLPGERDVPRF